MVTRLLGGRHWLALRRLGGRWWNLDSNLPAPQLVAACCSGEEQVATVGSSVPALAAPANAASTAGEGVAEAMASAAGAAQAEAEATAATMEAEAGGSIEIFSSGGALAGDSPQGVVAPAAEAAEESGAPTDAAAADAAAVRLFLMQQVRDRDAKVFRVLDSPLASHPLPPQEDCSPCSSSDPALLASH